MIKGLLNDNRLLERWRDTALTGQSIGDAMIVDVAEFYSQIGANVEIITGDAGLKTYEPVQSVKRHRKYQE